MTGRFSANFHCSSASLAAAKIALPAMKVMRLADALPRRQGRDLAPALLADAHLDADAPALLAALGDPDSLCCPVVVITGDCNADSGPALMRLGAQDFIGKEWVNAGSLARTVENAIERFALVRERSEQERKIGRRYCYFEHAGFLRFRSGHHS